MRRYLTTMAIALTLCSGSYASYGASGVVETRIDEMEKVGQAMKRLHLRTRSQQVSVEQARQAVALIRDVAQKTPALFEEPDMSPPSESKPEVWDNWSDFVARSEQLANYTSKLDDAVNDPDRLASEIKKIGEICSACHKRYRE